MEQDFINASLEQECEHEWVLKDQYNLHLIVCECEVCGLIYTFYSEDYLGNSNN